MAQKSKKGIKVRLVPKSTKDAKSTGKKLKVQYFKTTTRNAKMEGGVNGKIVKKMYNPVTRKHEEFVEEKI